MVTIEKLHAPTEAFVALVDTHTAFCDGTAPAESCHRLPVDALFVPEVTVWAAYDAGEMIGMGALKALSPTEGEVKSMHTRASARGKGVAKSMLSVIVAEAKAQGMDRISLETGAHADFAAARAMYARAGFAECPPFGDYVVDPHSIFMTLTLKEEAAI